MRRPLFCSGRVAPHPSKILSRETCQRFWSGRTIIESLDGFRYDQLVKLAAGPEHVSVLTTLRGRVDHFMKATGDTRMTDAFDRSQLKCDNLRDFAAIVDEFSETRGLPRKILRVPAACKYHH